MSDAPLSADEAESGSADGEGITPDPRPLSETPIQVIVEARAHGWRVDHYLSRLFPNYSRESFKRAIKQEQVILNGLPVKTSQRLRVNDIVSVSLTEAADSALPAEDLPLDVLFEDDDLIVINKAAGMITHPGKGNYTGTLASALQFHFDRLSDTAGSLRPGIVHRLDKDTSGVLVVAKDNQTHHQLSSQFEKREVRKTYEAIVTGAPEFDSDYIETFLRVHPRHRERMQVCTEGGKARDASTFYEVIDRFKGFGHIRLFPKTGRTHQLRVHMQHIGHPILADRQYASTISFAYRDMNVHITDHNPDDVLLTRQALHARHLEFRHPRSGKEMAFEAPLHEDMKQTLQALRTYCGR